MVGIYLENSFAYVIDGRELTSYRLPTAEAMWTTKTKIKGCKILSVIAGVLVYAEANDLVCRDVLTGAESLRFRSVLENSQSTPRYRATSRCICFESGWQLFDAGWTP